MNKITPFPIDEIRRKIVERSVEVLRKCGKSDDEIMDKLMHDFSIDKETMEEILKSV